VKYTTECYAGMEEHGLEVLSVYPGSPAAKAGLEGRSDAPGVAMGSVASGARFGAVETLIAPLLRRAGALGRGGDLIIAVDDQRVRTGLELEDQLRRLKPGDLMYLTILRPLYGGSHQTMRIAIKVGDLRR
jgi:S1-C subfamily serine protease